MERREFFQSLMAAGATPKRTRKHVKHEGERIYHGPMAIPAHVAESVREDPTPYRATGRGTHWVMRYAEADGTVYVFRCRVPESRQMVGEIIRTPIGRMRVCCWSAANVGDYREPDAIWQAAIERAQTAQGAK